MTLEERKQLILDYKSVFSGEAGKRVLNNLRVLCFMNKTTFHKDERMHVVQEGMRAVGLHIENSLSFDITKLETEQKGEEDV